MGDLQRAIEIARDAPYRPSPPPVFGVMKGHVKAGYVFGERDMGPGWHGMEFTAGEDLLPGTRLMIDPATGKIVPYRDEP
jgi:hypothetical protein